MNAYNWPASMSIGAITFKKIDAGVIEMIRQADVLMYDVKREGKNNIKHTVFE
jgi:GGDEF domain-containing protein